LGCFSGTPVFFANLLVDGETKNFIAGDDNYYLFTGKKINNNNAEFYGNLKEENCQMDCSPELKISFNSNNIEQLFGTTNIDFEESISSVKPMVRLFLNAASHGVPPFENTWLFEDGSTMIGDQVIKEFETNTTEKIRLTTIDGSGCENVQERNIELSDFPNSNSGCEDYVFFINSTPDSSVINCDIFIAIVGAETLETPDFVIWDDFSTQFFNCLPANDLPSEICVDIFNVVGCPEETFCLNLVENGSMSNGEFCTTQFSYSDEIIFVPNNAGNSESVFIEYEEDGEIYYSNILPQNASQFEILSFENYKANEKGNPTIKYTASFSCQLSTLSGEIIEMQADEIVFAVEK